MSALTVTNPEPWKYSEGRVVLGIVSDTHGPTANGDVFDVISGWGVDALLTAGDNTDDSLWTDFNNIVAEWRNRGIVWPVPGNHDDEDTIGGMDYLEGYLNNFDDYIGRVYYYVLKLGPIDFFMLDCREETPDGATYNSNQARWFADRVEESQAYWKVAIFHYSPYTSYTSYHNNAQAQQMQAWDWSGVDLCVSGHSHIYERLLVNDKPFIVCPPAGSTVRTSLTDQEGSIITYTEDHGALHWEVTPTKLVHQMRNTTNEIIDELILIK